jgi:hypothetical protein
VKTHHAALALAGWYLMAPPPVGGGIKTTAPLAQWRVVAAFDSADKCNDRQKLDLEEAHEKARTTEDSREREAALVMIQCQCIASDDPRLKEK